MSTPSTPDSPPWWREFFSPLYARVYRGPLDHPEATQAEVALLAETFGGAGGPILDVGCGFGRHATPLARRGFKVLGVDVMAHLLREMPRRGRWVVQADMRALPLRAGSMAGAYCLFNTFGYFTPRENRRVLAELARVLAPGAALVLQCPNRPAMARLVRSFPPRRLLTSDAMLTEVYHYDAATRSLVGEGHWMMGDSEQRWRFNLRLYSGPELARLLAGVGLALERHLAEATGEAFDPRTSTEQILIARRVDKARTPTRR